MRPRWRWTVLALALPALLAAAQDVVLTPGLVNLEFRFANSNQAVIDYLTAHTVRSISWAVSELPVRMFRPGEGQPAARTTTSSALCRPRPRPRPSPGRRSPRPARPSWSRSTTWPSPTAPPIDSEPRTRSLPRLEAAARCFPQETHPGGTACNLSECAALLQLRLSLKDDYPVPGGHADIDGLDEQVPIVCSGGVDVEEAAYSSQFVRQASASATFDLATLRGGAASCRSSCVATARGFGSASPAGRE